MLGFALHDFCSNYLYYAGLRFVFTGSWKVLQCKASTGFTPQLTLTASECLSQSESTKMMHQLICCSEELVSLSDVLVRKIFIILMKWGESSQLAEVCFTRKLGKKRCFTAERSCWCCFLPFSWLRMRSGERNIENKEHRLIKCHPDLWSVHLLPIGNHSSSECTVYVLLQSTHCNGKKPNFNNICICMNVK